MRKITFPCETAAIFDDVIFIIKPESRDDLESEIDAATCWFCQYFNEEKMIVRSEMLISFWGAISDAQTGFGGGMKLITYTLTLFTPITPYPAPTHIQSWDVNPKRRKNGNS